MTESFREAAKAAGYVGSGLQHDFPEAIAEVIQLAGGHLHNRRCSVSEIEGPLAESCKGFGQSFVEYHPNNAYGFVAEIRSASFNGKQPAQRVFVLLQEVKGRPLAVGSQPAKRTPFDLDMESPDADALPLG